MMVSSWEAFVSRLEYALVPRVTQFMGPIKAAYSANMASLKHLHPSLNITEG
jgi:hypothetical protein